jgi:hypothetical protein
LEAGLKNGRTVFEKRRFIILRVCDKKYRERRNRVSDGLLFIFSIFTQRRSF